MNRQAHYATLESAALEIFTFEPKFVPGLLQTPDYTRTLEYVQDLPGGEQEPFVDEREVRQRILNSMPMSIRPYRDAALRLHAIIHEDALTGGHDYVMGQQCAALANETRENVFIQLTRADPEYIPAFTIMRMPGHSLVYLENDEYEMAHYLYSDDDVTLYAGRFADLKASALTQEESRQRFKELS